MILEAEVAMYAWNHLVICAQNGNLADYDREIESEVSDMIIRIIKSMCDYLNRPDLTVLLTDKKVNYFTPEQLEVFDRIKEFEVLPAPEMFEREFCYLINKDHCEKK